MLGTKGVYFDKVDGAGSPPAETVNSTGAEGQPEAKPAGNEEGAGKDEKKFSQADVDLILKERLERQKKHTEAETEKARKKAEDEALEKNKEFQQLAETRQKTISELEAQIETLKAVDETKGKYEGALKKYLSEASKSMPKHVLPLIEKLDVVEALEYITANAKELGINALSTVPETPKEKGSGPTDEEKEAARKVAATHTHRTF